MDTIFCIGFWLVNTSPPWGESSRVLRVSCGLCVSCCKNCCCHSCTGLKKGSSSKFGTSHPWSGLGEQSIECKELFEISTTFPSQTTTNPIHELSLLGAWVIWSAKAKMRQEWRWIRTCNRGKVGESGSESKACAIVIFLAVCVYTVIIHLSELEFSWTCD